MKQTTWDIKEKVVRRLILPEMGGGGGVVATNMRGVNTEHNHMINQLHIFNLPAKQTYVYTYLRCA